MRFIDKKKYSLIVSGTKRGKKTFFTCNLEEGSDIMEGPFLDIRSRVQFSEAAVNTVFYSMEIHPEYTCFSIYRIILDWEDRPGFYAIALLMPPGYTFEKNTVVSQLKALSDLYWNRYIAPSTSPNQIRSDIRENEDFFNEELKKQEYALTYADDTIHYPAQRKLVLLRYKNEEDLSAIIENYHREELVQPGQVLLLAENEFNLVTNTPEITLPPIPVKTDLQITVKDGDTQLMGVNFTITKNGKTLADREHIREGVYTLRKLTANDRVTVTAEKENYNKTIVDEASIARGLKEGRELINLTVKLIKVESGVGIHKDPKKEDGNNKEKRELKDKNAQKLIAEEENRLMLEKKRKEEFEKKKKKEMRMIKIIGGAILLLIIGFFIGRRIGGSKAKMAEYDFTKARNSIDSAWNRYKERSNSELLYGEVNEHLERVKGEMLATVGSDSIAGLDSLNYKEYRLQLDKLHNAYLDSLNVINDKEKKEKEQARQDSMAEVKRRELEKDKDKTNKVDDPNKGRTPVVKPVAGTNQLSANDKQIINQAKAVLKQRKNRNEAKKLFKLVKNIYNNPKYKEHPDRSDWNVMMDELNDFSKEPD